VNHASLTERSELIAGLRQLAAFLEDRTDIPSPRWAEVYVFPSSTTDDAMKREIDAIATLIGSAVDDGVSEGLHYTASRRFGPVEYRAVAIPAGQASHGEEGA
jgi:hypothetical protein